LEHRIPIVWLHVLTLSISPLPEAPSRSEVHAGLVALAVDASPIALVADLERALQDTDLSHVTEEANPSKPELPLEVDSIRTRRDLGQRSRGEALSLDEILPSEVGRRPKRRLLQELSEGSGDGLAVAHEDLRRIFDESPSPLLLSPPPLSAQAGNKFLSDGQLLEDSASSLADSIDVPYILADGEIGMDDEDPNLDMSLLEDETPTSPSSSETDRLPSVTPASALAAFLLTRRTRPDKLPRRLSSVPTETGAESVAQDDAARSPLSNVPRPDNLQLLDRLGDEPEGGTLSALCGPTLVNKRKGP
jgi:hypothetical protein